MKTDAELLSHQLKVIVQNVKAVHYLQSETTHRTVSDFISECLQCKIHKRVNQRTHAVTQTKSMCCICVIAHGDQCNLTLLVNHASVNKSRF